MAVTEYKQWSCNGPDICQFLDRDHRTIHRWYQNLTYLLFVLAELFIITNHDIELTLVFIEQ